jgi:hypothetical protein
VQCPIFEIVRWALPVGKPRHEGGASIRESRGCGGGAWGIPVRRINDQDASGFPGKCLYWITSSACVSTAGGISRLSARAVVMLIADLNLIELTTGSSAGLSPLRIRPT